MKHYVSNARETPRMFQSNFLEFFSRVHWTVPPVIYLPIITWFLHRALATRQLPVGAVALWYAAGLLAWTMMEYTLHRFVFHYHPSSDWGRKIHWTFHGVHHDYPSDPLRLVMVPSVSLPLGALSYLAVRLLGGADVAVAFFPGLLTGYLFYDLTHYAVHHFPIKGAVFGRLREHHLRHHFSEPDRGYGVSSPLWDAVFRTTFSRKKAV
jgi:sterol desaturase/sphingolipid hydroxylase (fatty acid hydroxylase superfamily)